MVYSVDELKPIVEAVAKAYGVRRVGLFGSYAAGKANAESDVDLLIDKGELRGMIRFNQFVTSLEDALGKPVDVLTYASLSDSPMKDYVGHEVVLYERACVT